MERAIVLMPLRRSSPRGGGDRTTSRVELISRHTCDTVFPGPDYQPPRWIITGTSDGSLALCSKHKHQLQDVIRGDLPSAAQRLHHHPGHRPLHPHAQPHLLLLPVQVQATRRERAVRLQRGCFERSGQEAEPPRSNVRSVFRRVSQPGRTGCVSVFPRLPQEVSAEMVGDPQRLPHVQQAHLSPAARRPASA